VTWRPQRALERRIFSRETSWLVMDMLADPTPRHATFGQELPLDLPYPVAAKTGTSRGFADTVAVGVTREITAAAWAGNFDGDPTQGLIAMKSAAPLVRAGLQIGARGRRLSLPDAPPEIIEAQVCPLSGMAPSEHCPHRKREYFRAGQVPREPCDWHRPGGVVRYPAEARAWARDRHRRAGRVP
jgi:penicillin-binding protein 1C